MTNNEALETVRLLGTACAFDCKGDVSWKMGARVLSQADVNLALSQATDCVACPSGWRVTTVDHFGDLLIVELKIESTTVVGLGP